MELEKLFEDNTKMFARIYTQKSEYRYGKMAVLMKKKKIGNKSLKENYGEIEMYGKERDKEKGNLSMIRESKILKMRRMCGGQVTSVIPDLK